MVVEHLEQCTMNGDEADFLSLEPFTPSIESTSAGVGS